MKIFDTKITLGGTMTETKVFCSGDISKGRVLVIGHDPRLQRSGTIAEYCFFADYFFRPKPTKKSELSKYKLAESLFSYIRYLTSNRYTDDELIITNLCNRELKHAPKGKTVLIPEEYAKKGIADIENILKSCRQIEIIFAMSQQVNYWLQKLGLYSSTENYISQSEPKKDKAARGYYEPKGTSPFLEICGNKYFVNKIPLFPVLHVKQFPLKGNIKKNYEPAYTRCINLIKEL